MSSFCSGHCPIIGRPMSELRSYRFGLNFRSRSKRVRFVHSSSLPLQKRLRLRRSKLHFEKRDPTGSFQSPKQKWTTTGELKRIFFFVLKHILLLSFTTSFNVLFFFNFLTPPHIPPHRETSRPLFIFTVNKFFQTEQQKTL
jgi:hypothetical protein